MKRTPNATQPAIVRYDIVHDDTRDQAPLTPMSHLSLPLNTVGPPLSEHNSARYLIETIRVRLNAAEPPPAQKAHSVHHATTILHRLFATMESDQEHFLILGLNSKNAMLRYKLISSGGQNTTLIDPTLVFRYALLMGSMRIILAHNHPAGDPTPSEEDRRLTTCLTRVGRALDLPVLDHIIIAPPDRSYSFAQSGRLPQ